MPLPRTELDERRHRKLRFAVQEAALHATGEELLLLEDTVNQLRCEQITITDAHGLVRVVLHAQHERHRSAAA